MSRPVSILWFRRDLRFHDHPALAKASRRGKVVPLFVLDPALMGPAGLPRRIFLLRSLRDLDRRLRELGAPLVVRQGRPEVVIPEVARSVRASEVHLSADFGPYGAARDRRVREALGSIPLVATGSPYAVSPHKITRSDGQPYKVFTAYFRAWRHHGWPPPAAVDPHQIEWMDGPSDDLPHDPSSPDELVLPPAGEGSAHKAWEMFRKTRLPTYDDTRDRPDLDATSRLSPYLHLGMLHPRTLLAALGPDHERFTKELAWREFYSSVLWSWPHSARQSFDARMNGIAIDEGPVADALFDAWREGHTGYPIIDAGMRQLRTEAWMHNRVRMLVASFLVRDLHLDWRRGARHFMRLLVDGDLASNQHGWQWTAGTGTDASPYFRIFNPITQAKRFDPDGSYIRRWIPELRSVPQQYLYEPWDSPTPIDYVRPIVDHDVERRRSLAAYQTARQIARNCRPPP